MRHTAFFQWLYTPRCLVIDDKQYYIHIRTHMITNTRTHTQTHTHTHKDTHTHTNTHTHTHTPGKMCLHNEELAKKCVVQMVRELETSKHQTVRNNLIIILCDLTVRYSAKVDPYIDTISACLKDQSLVRKSYWFLVVGEEGLEFLHKLNLILHDWTLPVIVV